MGRCGAHNEEMEDIASFVRLEGMESFAVVRLTIEGKIKFKLSYIEVMSSVVTEIVGKDAEDEEAW